MAMLRDEYLVRAHEFVCRGNDYKSAKLTPEKVRWIRKNEKGMTAKAQAAELNVHYRTVEKVRHFETWRHIGD